MNPKPQVKSDPRRALPSVDRLRDAVLAGDPRLPSWAVAEGARRALAAERERLADPERAMAPATDQEALEARSAALAAALAAPHPTRVVNATGTILHTNLGRAPLAPGAAEAACVAASSYADLEIDLASGERGDRTAAVAEKLRLLSGAEAALAVNNNAAALLLALDSLARGREVVVSRGELVEIGGSFRIPEIMERAGVTLVEVGSTNRTHPRDYETAIGPDTALLLKVHRSNFEQRGFVSEVGLPELVEIGRARGLPVLEDLGSGTLVDLSGRGFPAEAYAPARLRIGADAVCFSGDKLLGGPQAGLLLGSEASLSAMRVNPLARALRLDKMSLSALDWTLSALLDGREQEIPVIRQLLAPVAALEVRARRLAKDLAAVAGGDVDVSAEANRSVVGGGSLPGFELETWQVVLRSGGASDLAARLRAAPVPVLARVRDDRVLLDVRTLLDGDDAALGDSLAFALGRSLR